MNRTNILGFLRALPRLPWAIWVQRREIVNALFQRHVWLSREDREAFERHQGEVALRDLGRTHWEYGVERSFASINDGEPFIEWRSSVGMSHHYDYTENSVHALADGNRVFRRTVTTFPIQYGEPEPFPRSES